jgi:hypothetical protein
MGQKMVRFGELRGTRSRQGASKEVHDAGRIRPSSGSNGGHIVSLYPQIWRSLGATQAPFWLMGEPQTWQMGGEPQTWYA